MKEYEIDYHIKTIEHVYRSTEVFVEWLENRGFLGEHRAQILDMACGSGANTIYMGGKFKNVNFIGMDLNEELILYGNDWINNHSGYDNCKLYREDWFNIGNKWVNTFDGIISFQTLLMFSDYKYALKKLAFLKPKWIAVSSLFYEGDIEYTVKLRDYYRSEDNKNYMDIYYNIHSLIRFKKYMGELGYRNFEYLPFEIDIDLPKKDSMDIGTYTINTETGKRIQISAAMMMPWYFVIAYK